MRKLKQLDSFTTLFGFIHFLFELKKSLHIKGCLRCEAVKQLVLIPFVELKVGEQKPRTAPKVAHPHMNVKNEEAKKKRMKKCLSETSARLTNRDDPLKHRRLHDYDAVETQRTSRDLR